MLLVCGDATALCLDGQRKDMGCPNNSSSSTVRVGSGWQRERERRGGLRRGELFALRWRDLDDATRSLSVDEAVYEGTFATPKTAAGVRRIPLADAAWQLVERWRARAPDSESDALVFATRSGKPIGPNNVLPRWVFLRAIGCSCGGRRGSHFGGRIPHGPTTRACPPRSSRS